MPSAHLSLREAEVVKMVLEFLDNRRLHISQLSLERETGVINGRHSDDMLFLRQLILDGQWDDVLEFVQPLEGIDGFDSRRFKYVVCRHKYEELLCIRSEVMQTTAGSVCSQEVDVAVDEMVKCLDDMERLAPSKDEYSSLCLLLTLPRLTDHPEYREWNPSSARVECFKTIHPLVDKYLPTAPQHHPGAATSKGGGSHNHFATAKNDRLVQLIIKGALYESCVEFCQQKATGDGGGMTKASHDSVQFSGLLDNDGSKGFTDADLSLPSWLQSIPHDIFACPFEQRTLNVDVEALQRPDLEASWTEHILVTPIKPKTFPHSAMPTNARPSSTAAAAAAGLMSRSLNPQLDGLPFGLAASQRYLMALSVGDVACMSKSFAGFHLTGKKSMSTSVDKLFEGLDKTSSDAFNASSYYGDLPAALSDKVAAAAAAAAVVDPKCSTANGRLRTPIVGTNVILAQTKNTAGHDQEIDILDRLSDKDSSAPGANPPLLANALGASDSTQLYKEYQRQKLKIQEDLANQERRRDEYLKQLMEIEVGQEIMTVADNRLCDDQDKLHLVPSHLNQQRHFLDPMCASTPKQSIVSSLEPSASSKHLTSSSSSASAAASSSSTSNCAQKRNCPMDASSLCTPLDSSVVILQGTPTPLARAYNVQPSQQQQQQQYSHQDNLPPQSQLRAKHGFISPNRTVNVTAATTSGGSHSSNGSAGQQQQQVPGPKPKFIPVTSLEDVQAIRAAEFHPSGKLYAIGSNSKTLRVCAYPRMTDLREDHETHQPTVLFKRTRHHKGSIYCLAWNATGDLLATGSNDKTVRLMRFNAETCNVEGDDIELSMHDGTVRDVCFVEDLSNKSSLLISGGAGDCKIYVTDCVTGTPFQAMSGHSGHILALYTWGGAMFVSGSQDRTIRFWDLRTRGCVNVIPSPPPNGSSAIKGSAVATVAVDPSGRMLVSGQEDASCMLYDIRGNRIIQCFKPHTSDIRTIRFSPKAYYLLSGSYDNKVVLTDLQGDLTLPLPSLVVSEHQDKVIQCRWHPTDFAYLSTSADKTATLWGLPPN